MMARDSRRAAKKSATMHTAAMHTMGPITESSTVM